MPTYEYACSSCGEHLEIVQSFRDDPLTTCPACGGPLRKVFGSIGVVFKGSGFYKTDSRPGGKTAKESKEKKEPAASGSSSASSSDSGSSTSTPSTGSSSASGSSSSGSGSGSSSSSTTAAAS